MNFFDKYIKNANTDWSNKDHVIKQVRNDGLKLEYAESYLKCDFDIVKEAVRNNGEALKYACDELRGNEEIAYAALSNEYGCIGNSRYIADRLINDYEFSSRILNEFCILTFPYRNNREMAFRYLSILPTSAGYNSIGDELLSDKSFILEALQDDMFQSVRILSCTSDELKNDEEVVTAAIKGWPDDFRYASKNIKHKKSFRKLYLKMYSEYFSESATKYRLEKILRGDE